MKDTNELFLKIIGINHKVYEFRDIFKIDRDKQADEKKYNNYINNDDRLSNKAFFNYQRKNIAILYDFLSNEFSKDDEFIYVQKRLNFYINELVNITLNYHIFNKINDKFMRNMFSFQIAYIVEYMSYEGIDVELFDASIEKEGIDPFINYIKELHGKSKNKDLALMLSYEWYDMLEKLKKHNTRLKPIQESTYCKKISTWTSTSLPSFLDTFMLCKLIFKKNDKNILEVFIQLLLVRSLLQIEKQRSVKKVEVDLFVKNLTTYRKRIRENYRESQSIRELQSNYLFFIMSDKLYDDNSSMTDMDIMNKIYKRSKKFIDNNNFLPRNLNVELEDREEILELFRTAKYNDVLNILNNNNKNDYIKYIINNLKFIVSLKIGDKKLINKMYKEYERSFPLLSLVCSDFDKDEYIKLISDIYDLESCIESVNSKMFKMSKVE